MIGFEKVNMLNEEQKKEEDFLILNVQRFDINEFNLLINIIDDIFKKNNLTPLTKNLKTNKEERKESNGRLYVPTNMKK